MTQKPITALTIALTTATLVLASPARAVDFEFFFDAITPGAGENVYTANHDDRGIPLDLDPTIHAIPDGLLERINTMLPESQHIDLGHPELIASDEQATIHVTEEADIWITFLHEGAGYKNSFGFYTYDENDPPASTDDIDHHVVVFPNASYYNRGGSPAGLETGQRVYLGTFPAGTVMGFFLASDAWDADVGVELYQGNWKDGWIFYNKRAFNLETDESLRPHFVLMNDQVNEQLVLGIEDILRTNSGCDHDFNDLLFSIQADPYTAIDDTYIPVLEEVIDTDGDGINDEEEDYPDDPERAFDVEYKGYLAFEDEWPLMFDYDVNDVVLRYTTVETQDADGDIKDIVTSYVIRASGASKRFSPGFGVNFPNLAPTALDSANVAIDYPEGEKADTSDAIGSEDGQSTLTLIAFEDIRSHVGTWMGSWYNGTSDWDWTCAWSYRPRWFNTDHHCQYDQGPTITLSVTFDAPRSRAEVGAVPYNPFIFPKFYRYRETHLANMPPTDKFEWRFVGYADDTSDPNSGRWFKNACDQPWGIHIATDGEWHHLEEAVENDAYCLDESTYEYSDRDLRLGYPQFEDWVFSSGTLFTDWYLFGVDEYLFGQHGLKSPLAD